jgi:hypothetical protein
MTNESGAARAKYREASQKEKEHLAKHMSVHFADDEIRIGFGVACGDQNCPFPHTTVTVTVSPETVKIGPHPRNYREAVDGTKESEHLKKHLRLHLDHESHEVRLGYGIDCDKKEECIFPRTDVTLTVCPYYPCKPLS